MKDVKIRISADTAEAKNNVKDLAKEVLKVGDEAVKAEGQVEGVGKAAKKSKGGFSSMGKGIKGVGVALKAAGIGLIVAVVAGLTEAFSRNKKIMDKVGIVMGTIQEVFSQIANALIATYEAVASSSDNFDALGKVMSGILTVVISPFQLAFYGIKKALLTAQLAWEDSFFGDGDETKMAELRKSIQETAADITRVADGAMEAAKSVGANISEAIDEVVNISNIASENLSKVSIEAAAATAKAYQQATDASIIAQAEAGKLIAFYDRQAEQQRQIRDNANASIEERQAANVKLGEILEEQEKQLLRQADAVLAGARAEVAKNDSIENRAALISAEAAKSQVLADIEGKRSEQISNTNTLLLEQKALTTSVINAERDRAKARRDFEAEIELDPIAKVQKQREALELENQAIKDDLDAKRLLYKEGTQQRVDAEQEYLNKKQGLTQAVVKLDQAEADAKLATLQAISGGIASLGKLAGENASLQKATGVASAIIDTYVGANKAFAQGGTIGFVTGAAVIAAGLANVSTILSTKIPNESGGSQSVPQGGASAPAFNLIEGTGDNSSIENSINNQGNTPVKAYVTSGDVTSQQAADRAAESNSGF
tara:strand:- start:23 stop:1825 length:1803 start_codon:yes stop_codon:yes gene_type:complete